MAEYGYTSRGYTTYIDDSNKPPSYGGSGYSEHVCRPVIIDAEGRKRAVISYTPNNSGGYITRESYVEHVQTPIVVTEYEYRSPTKVEQYGIANNRWGRPSSSPVYDHPQKVEEFITKVQIEASRPARTGFPSPAGYNGTTGYGEYSNFSNSDWNNPSGNTNTIRDESFDDYYRRNDILKEPTVINKERWERPSPRGWATTRPSTETPLSKPTNDIAAAVEYLKEAAQALPVIAAAPQSRLTYPGPSPRGWVTRPSIDTPPSKPTNDSGAAVEYPREAAKPLPVTATAPESRLTYPGPSPRGWATRPSTDTPLSKPTNDSSAAVEYPREAAKPLPVTAAAPESGLTYPGPSPRGWATRPSIDTPPSKPTNDTGATVEYLKEAAQPLPVTASAPQSRLTNPVSVVPKRDTYTETIDSKEAQRRYGNFNLASRVPFRTEEAYTGTIDSREAARKYKGTSV